MPAWVGHDMTDIAAALAQVVAGREVSDSLAEAVSAGSLRLQSDGTWLRPNIDPTPSDWVRKSQDASRHCRFYMGVMFNHVYRKQQVPAGCATCFKVKVVPQSLRQLVAVRRVAEAMPYTYKCGLDAAAPYTSGIYGAYFYLHGVEAARSAYQALRAAIDADAKLGPGVNVFVKRGCTDYEMHCGPSDRYSFQPWQHKLEATLLAQIRLEPRPPSNRKRVMETMTHWIKTAYRLGDDTYLDFTGGQRLYPAVVRYETGAGGQT